MPTKTQPAKTVDSKCNFQEGNSLEKTEEISRWASSRLQCIALDWTFNTAHEIVMVKKFECLDQSLQRKELVCCSAHE